MNENKLKTPNLQCIQHLFFYLFQFIFHLDYDVLHFCMVRFASGSIDFPAHFLCNEAQFLSLTVTSGHRFAEVFQMVGKSLFFFADVEFLNIVNELLFQAVFVVVNAFQFFQTLCQALADLFNARFLKRFDFSEKTLNVVDFL